MAIMTTVDEQNKSTERLSEAEARDILQTCSERGERLEITLERRGQIPNHWDRHKTTVVTIKKGAGPDAERASSRHTPNDVIAVDGSENYRLCGSGEIYARKRNTEIRRVPIGHITDITKL